MADNTKQRKERFQGLLSYFENFAIFSTPKKSKVPKTPKSESKLNKKFKTPKSDSKVAKLKKTPKSESKTSTKKLKAKKFDSTPVPMPTLHDKENIPNTTNTPTKIPQEKEVLMEVRKESKKETKKKENKENENNKENKENKEAQIQEVKEKEKKEVQIQEVKKKEKKEKDCYDSDSSYAHTTSRKKRRQSFSSVRTPKKSNRRMTLGACEISPILLQKHANIQTRPLSWTRGSATPTPLQIKRSLCAGEILQTEENFVARLELLKKMFMQPLQAEKILTTEEVNSIFSNMELILNVNRALLSDLKDLMHDWEDSKIVGDIFVKVIPFLKIYTDYVNNHQSALETIDHLTAKNAEFKTFVEVAQKEEACNGLLLRDFLIDPVQRIPRYELLLKELLKNTPVDHPDHTPLETALDEVKRVANILNEKNREQKSRLRMLEVQKLIEAEFQDLIQPHRILIEESNVMQMPSRTPVTLFLFNDLLIIAEFSNDKKTVKLLGNNLLETVWIVHSGTVHESQKDTSSFGYTYASDCLDPEIGELVAKELVFEVLWPGNKFVFLCKSQEECEKLANTIEAIITELTTKQQKASISRSNYRLYRDAGGIWEVTAPPVAERITREQYEAEAVDYTQRAIQELLNANALAIRSLSERKRKRKSGFSGVIQRLTPKKARNVSFNTLDSAPSTPSCGSPSQSAASSPYRPSNVTSTPTSITNTPISAKKAAKLNSSSPQITRTDKTATVLSSSTSSLSSSSSSLRSSSSSITPTTSTSTAASDAIPPSPRPSRKRPSLALDPEVPNGLCSSSSSSSSTSSSLRSSPTHSPKARRRSLNSSPNANAHSQSSIPRLNAPPSASPRPVRRKSLPSTINSTGKVNTVTASPRPLRRKSLNSAPNSSSSPVTLTNTPLSPIPSPLPSPRPARRRQSNGGNEGVRSTPKPTLSSAILHSPQTPRSSLHTPSRTKTPKKVLFAATP